MTYTKSMSEAIACFALTGRAVSVCPPAHATGIGKFTPTKTYQRPAVSTVWYQFYNDRVSCLAH